MKQMDNPVWTSKAMAFATRTHRHLWGKNNQDPLAFLFQQGLSVNFSRSLYLGWNKFGQDRPRANWGLTGEGTFHIPSGIVYPYIVDKQLLSVYIISMDRPGEVSLLPGSHSGPLVLGRPGKGAGSNTKDLLSGLVLHQNEPDLEVIIEPDLRP